MKRLLIAIVTLAILSPSLNAQDTTRNTTRNRGTEQQSRSSQMDRNDSSADSNRKKSKKNKKNKDSSRHVHNDTARYRR